MSTPPGRMPAPRDSLKLLSAILTGLVLGFFAVLFDNHMLPWQEPRRTLAHTDTPSGPPLAKAAAFPAPAAVTPGRPQPAGETEAFPGQGGGKAAAAREPARSGGEQSPAKEDGQAPAAAARAPEPAKAASEPPEAPLADASAPAKAGSQPRPGPCLGPGLHRQARKIAFRGRDGRCPAAAFVVQDRRRGRKGGQGGIRGRVTGGRRRRARRDQEDRFARRQEFRGMEAAAQPPSRFQGRLGVPARASLVSRSAAGRRQRESPVSVRCASRGRAEVLHEPHALDGCGPCKPRRGLAGDGRARARPGDD